MKSKTALSITYTLLHLLVDFTTIYLVCRVLLGYEIGMVQRAEVIIVYNLVAFAGQLPIGIIADGLNKNRVLAFSGCAMSMLAYPISAVSPWASCILASLGNGAFHIGAGSEILKISMPKAGIAGIFVSSGAVGVWLAYNFSGNSPYVFLPCLMLLSCIVLLFFTDDAATNEPHTILPYSMPRVITCVAACCFLLTIVIRSFIGMSADFPWKSVPVWSLMNVIAIAGGKAIGGIIADRFGYIKTSAGSLLISLLTFVFSFDIPVCGIIAIFCFNMTMPLTLTAIAQMCGKKYGFAFGLTTFALAVGFIPMVFGAGGFFGIPVIMISVISSLVMLVVAFRCRHMY